MKLLKELEIKVFGGVKTTQEKIAIIRSDMEILDGKLNQLSIDIVKTTIKSVIKKVGPRQAVNWLRENREDFEALLPKERLNEIFKECLKPD